jgi:hypothetical protein
VSRGTSGALPIPVAILTAPALLCHFRLGFVYSLEALKFCVKKREALKFRPSLCEVSFEVQLNCVCFFEFDTFVLCAFLIAFFLTSLTNYCRNMPCYLIDN